MNGVSKYSVQNYPAKRWSAKEESSLPVCQLAAECSRISIAPPVPGSHLGMMSNKGLPGAAHAVCVVKEGLVAEQRLVRVDEDVILSPVVSQAARTVTAAAKIVFQTTYV
jgi:hypothetical protein